MQEERAAASEKKRQAKAYVGTLQEQHRQSVSQLQTQLTQVTTQRDGMSTSLQEAVERYQQTEAASREARREHEQQLVQM